MFFITFLESVKDHFPLLNFGDCICFHYFHFFPPKRRIRGLIVVVVPSPYRIYKDFLTATRNLILDSVKFSSHNIYVVGLLFSRPWAPLAELLELLFPHPPRATRTALLLLLLLLLFVVPSPFLFLQKKAPAALIGHQKHVVLQNMQKKGACGSKSQKTHAILLFLQKKGACGSKSQKTHAILLCLHKKGACGSKSQKTHAILLFLHKKRCLRQQIPEDPRDFCYFEKKNVILHTFSYFWWFWWLGRVFVTTTQIN